MHYIHYIFINEQIKLFKIYFFTEPDEAKQKNKQTNKWTKMSNESQERTMRATNLVLGIQIKGNIYKWRCILNDTILTTISNVKPKETIEYL